MLNVQWQIMLFKNSIFIHIKLMLVVVNESLFVRLDGGEWK